MLSAVRPGQNITRNVQHFKSKQTPDIGRQGDDNDDDDEDDIVVKNTNKLNIPVVEPQNITQEHRKRYLIRQRNRPEHFHEQYQP